jgi:17 kDa outer membrane surface antigen
MTRMVTGGLIVLPFLGLFSVAAAQSDFEDIPYLQVRINQVLEREPTGAEVEWHNEATGNSGVIRVLKTYFPSPDAPCRDYERTTRQPGGGEKVVRGTGCRDASGRWGLKEQEEAAPPEPGSWSPATPAQGSATSGQTGGQTGGQSGQTGGQAGQAGGQSGQTGGQSGQTGGLSGVQTGGEAGSAGQAGASSQSKSGPSTSVLPSASEPEPAAPQAEPDPPKPPAAKPSEPEPSPPDFDLPTPSD